MISVMDIAGSLQRHEVRNEPTQTDPVLQNEGNIKTYMFIYMWQVEESPVMKRVFGVQEIYILSPA